MRFVHLTDPHLTSLQDWGLSRLWGKRWLGYLSWRRKRRRQLRREMLDRSTAAALAERPALIAVTGDLVHLGLPGEIRAAREWLLQLGPPERVFLVPGNHDVYARDSWPAVAAHWGDYLRLDDVAAGGDGRNHYPALCETDGIALIGASSALPTAPLLATGSLGSAQLARLADTLAGARRRGAFICLLIHHPPVTALTHWRKQLHESAALEELLRGARVEVALHGHLHRDRRTLRGATRVYGGASASSAIAAAPASYRVFDIDRHAAGWSVTMTLKRYCAESQEFVVADRECWFAPRQVAS